MSLKGFLYISLALNIFLIPGDAVDWRKLGFEKILTSTSQ